MMPQYNVVKTRIRASILAGSTGTTVNNAGKVQENITVGSTNGGGTTPQAKTIGNLNGFFGE